MSNRDVENNIEEATGHDEADSKLMVTIDSAGVRYGDSSPVPLHSCINIATQVTPDEAHHQECQCWPPWFGRVVMKRAAVIVAILLVIAVIVLMEKLLGADILDEKKLIQDLAGELLPSLRNPLTSPTPPTQAAQ
jgi:hypothetical protein